MRLHFVVLANSALSDPAGITSVLGLGIQTLNSVPLTLLPPGAVGAIQPGSVGLPVKFAVIARLFAKRIEMGKQHILEISVQGEDGEIVFQAKIAMQLKEAAQLPQGQEQPVLAAADITIPVKRFGNYSVEITVDGDHKGSEPFRIIEASLASTTS